MGGGIVRGGQLSAVCNCPRGAVVRGVPLAAQRSARGGLPAVAIVEDSNCPRRVVVRGRLSARQIVRPGGGTGYLLPSGVSPFKYIYIYNDNTHTLFSP